MVLHGQQRVAPDGGLELRPACLAVSGVPPDIECLPRLPRRL